MSITQETRREAYERVEPRSIRMKIADLLASEGGMTSSEIMERMGYANPNTVRLPDGFAEEPFLPLPGQQPMPP